MTSFATVTKDKMAPTQLNSMTAGWVAFGPQHQQNRNRNSDNSSTPSIHDRSYFYWFICIGFIVLFCGRGL
jgi:hypothetical protein